MPRIRDRPTSVIVPDRANRAASQRQALVTGPEELLARVENSTCGPESKALLREFVATESTGGIGFAVYDVPPVLVRAKGATVWDADGKAYIDMIAGFSVANIGQVNPSVVAAIREQAGELLHCFDLPNRPRTALARQLLDLSPGKHEKRVAFGVTGSDATEIAMRMARWYTGAPIILSAHGGYHGMTAETIAAGGRARAWAYCQPTGPHDSGHAKIPYPYPYRCLFGSSDPEECASRCVEFLRMLLSGSSTPLGGGKGDICNVAAVLVEPMQGAGGYIIPPPSFLQGLRELCDEFGILLILDEIQTGLGRTGKLWGCEHSGVIPDIMAIGKSLGGGLPISAVVARSEIAASWGPGAHLSTFAATPLASAAANAVLEYLVDNNLPDRAATTGVYLKDRLLELSERHNLIGSVDSCGLFTGIEFVRDRQTKEPASEEAAWMLEFCKTEGLLLQRGGPHGNRFMLIPPLVITEDEIDEGLAILSRALVAVNLSAAAGRG